MVEAASDTICFSSNGCLMEFSATSKETETGEEKKVRANSSMRAR